MLSVYTDRQFPSAIRSVYTEGRILSVYTDRIADGLYRFLKSCNNVMTWIFFIWFYRRNDWGIQTEISVQWRGTVTCGLTDGTCPLMIPSVKANIYSLCRLSLPLFLLLLPHPNSPLPNCSQPPIPSALMWIINYFPAYEIVSGWSTHGKLACSYCMENNKAFTLTNRGKASFFYCHRRFLPLNHRYRKNRKDFLLAELKRMLHPRVFLLKNCMMLYQSTVKLCLVSNQVSKNFLVLVWPIIG